MQPMSSCSPSPQNRTTCMARLCAVFLLLLRPYAVLSDAVERPDNTLMDFLHSTQGDGVLNSQQISQSPTSRHKFLANNLPAAYHAAMAGVSVSDLQSRRTLEQIIQTAAFEQFGRQKTGQLYNVSVSAAPSTIVRAIRLRSGSFRRYGVTVNEFVIPRGCEVNPAPERILLVYARLINTTLFESLPQGYVLASPVLSVLAYDAINLISNSRQPAKQITISTTENPIIIRFGASSGERCAAFDENSTNVSYTDLMQGDCQVTHAGDYALVRRAPAPSPSPSPSPSSSPSPSPSLLPASIELSSSRSNTWKVVVGSVVGGFGLLVLLSLLALGMARRRKRARFAKMEYQAENGETLQSTNIRNSRVPAAGSTRTQSMIEREYSV